jgi:hypothetical protein
MLNEEEEDLDDCTDCPFSGKRRKRDEKEEGIY